MEPENYSTIRSILKAQGDTKTLQEYLDKENITYEIYQKKIKIKNKKIK